jgi:hypothetical protein
MTVLRTIPMVLASLVFAAHVMRWGYLWLVLVVVAMPVAALLIWRRPAMRAMQALLLLAAAEWVRTAVTIGMRRHADGEPWTRMAVILAAVAAFTVFAALIVPMPGKIAPKKKA